MGTVANAIDINGSGSEVKAAFDAIDTNTGNATANITGTDYTVAQLKAINNATTGAIVLATSTNQALSGDATDLAAALDGTINYTGNVTVTDSSYTVAELKAINAGTTGEIALSDAGVALSGSATDIADAFAGTITQHTGTVTITGTVSVTNFNTINGKTNGAIAYSLSDTAGNISGASSAIVNGATAITVTDTGAGADGNIVDLDNVTNVSTINSVTITGDAGIDQIELSTVLSESGKVSINFVSDDGDVDKLVFNVHDDNTNWVTYAANGTATGSFSFNTITNWAAVDQIGIFNNGNCTTIGAFQELTGSTTSTSYRLRDCIIYEDSLNSDSGLTLTSAYANNESNIRANIQSI